MLNTEWTEVEIIELFNDGAGLGFGIIGTKSTGVVVRSIQHGSPSYRNGRIRIGDHILYVDSMNVRSLNSDQVASILRQAGDGVRLIVARPIHDASTATTPMPPTSDQISAAHWLQNNLHSACETATTPPTTMAPMHKFHWSMSTAEKENHNESVDEKSNIDNVTSADYCGLKQDVQSTEENEAIEKKPFKSSSQQPTDNLNPFVFKPFLDTCSVIPTSCLDEHLEYLLTAYIASRTLECLSPTPCNDKMYSPHPPPSPQPQPPPPPPPSSSLPSIPIAPVLDAGNISDSVPLCTSQSDSTNTTIASVIKSPQEMEEKLSREKKQSKEEEEDLARDNNCKAMSKQSLLSIPPTMMTLTEDMEELAVTLEKGEKGLGITIAGYVSTSAQVPLNGIFVKCITPNSAAEKSGLIQMHDQIIEVNGEPLHGLDNHQAVDILKKATSPVSLKIVRYKRGPIYEQLKWTVKAPPPLHPPLIGHQHRQPSSSEISSINATSKSDIDNKSELVCSSSVASSTLISIATEPVSENSSSLMSRVDSLSLVHMDKTPAITNTTTTTTTATSSSIINTNTNTTNTPYQVSTPPELLTDNNVIDDDDNDNNNGSNQEDDDLAEDEEISPVHVNYSHPLPPAPQESPDSTEEEFISPSHIHFMDPPLPPSMINSMEKVPPFSQSPSPPSSLSPFLSPSPMSSKLDNAVQSKSITDSLIHLTTDEHSMPMGLTTLDCLEKIQTTEQIIVGKDGIEWTAVPDNVAVASQCVWEKLLGRNFEIVTVLIRKSKQGGNSLGFSMRGTIDVEDETQSESNPHHYIHHIVMEISGCDSLLKPGDELLEVNGTRLYGLPYPEVLTILRATPAHVQLVCARPIPSSSSPHSALTRHTIPTPLCTDVEESLINGHHQLHPTSLSRSSSLNTTEALVSDSDDDDDDDDADSFIDFHQHSLKAKSNEHLSLSSEFPLFSDIKRSKSLHFLEDVAVWSAKPMIIELIKTEKGLGFSIIGYKDPSDGGREKIIILALVPGGLAHRDGRICPGDWLVFVNDHSFINITTYEAASILKKTSINTHVTLGIIKPIVLKNCPLNNLRKQQQQQQNQNISENHNKDVFQNEAELFEKTFSKLPDVPLSLVEELEIQRLRPSVGLVMKSVGIGYMVMAIETKSDASVDGRIVEGDIIIKLEGYDLKKELLAPVDVVLEDIAARLPYGASFIIHRVSRSRMLHHIRSIENNCEINSVARITPIATTNSSSVVTSSPTISQSNSSHSNIFRDPPFSATELLSPARHQQQKPNLIQISTQVDIHTNFPTKKTSSDSSINHLYSEDGSNCSGRSPEPLEHIPEPVTTPVESARSEIFERVDCGDIDEAAMALLPPPMWKDTKIVILNRRQEGSTLGVTILGCRVYGRNLKDGEEKGVFIKKVTEGSPADLCGELKPGDRILEVNGVNLRDSSHDAAVEAIRKATSPVTLLVQCLAEDTELEYVTSATHTPLLRRASNGCSNPPTIATSEPSKAINKVPEEEEIQTQVENESDKKLIETTVCVSRENKDGVKGNSDDDDDVDESDEISDEDEVDCYGYTPAIIRKRYKSLSGETFILTLPWPTTKSHNNITNNTNNVDATTTPVVYTRSSNSLGIRVAGHKDFSQQAIFVSAINADSAIAADGRLQFADRLLEVNGISLVGRSHQNATPIIRQCLNKAQVKGEIKLVVNRSEQNLVNIAVHAQPVSLPPSLLLNAGDVDQDDGIDIENVTMIHNVEDGTAIPQSTPNHYQSIVSAEEYEIYDLMLEKGPMGLGFFIMDGGFENEEGTYIKQVTPEGIAAKEGTLRKGDRLLSVNSNNVNEMNYEAVLELLRNSSGYVQLTIGRKKIVKYAETIVSHVSPPTTPPTVPASQSGVKELSDIEAIAPPTSSTISTTTTVATTIPILNKETPATIAAAVVVPESSKIDSNIPIDSQEIKPGREEKIIIQKDNELGISIVGGVDTMLGAILVHEVHTNGSAAKDGRLWSGDRILAVNDCDLRQATHDEAIQALRNTGKDVCLTIYRDKKPLREEDIMDVFTVTLNKSSKRGLGLSIVSKSDVGVCVSDLVKGGVAEHDGHLHKGDLILEINGENMRSSTQDQVAATLKRVTGKCKLVVGRLKPETNDSNPALLASSFIKTKKSGKGDVAIPDHVHSHTRLRKWTPAHPQQVLPQHLHSSHIIDSLSNSSSFSSDEFIHHCYHSIHVSWFSSSSTIICDGQLSSQDSLPLIMSTTYGVKLQPAFYKKMNSHCSPTDEQQLMGFWVKSISLDSLARLHLSLHVGDLIVSVQGESIQHHHSKETEYWENKFNETSPYIKKSLTNNEPPHYQLRLKFTIYRLRTTHCLQPRCPTAQGICVYPHECDFFSLHERAHF